MATHRAGPDVKLKDDAITPSETMAARTTTPSTVFLSLNSLSAVLCASMFTRMRRSHSAGSTPSGRLASSYDPAIRCPPKQVSPLMQETLRVHSGHFADEIVASVRLSNAAAARSNCRPAGGGPAPLACIRLARPTGSDRSALYARPPFVGQGPPAPMWSAPYVGATCRHRTAMLHPRIDRHADAAAGTCG
jgi:hypothetical protein